MDHNAETIQLANNALLLKQLNLKNQISNEPSQSNVLRFQSYKNKSFQTHFFIFKLESKVWGDGAVIQMLTTEAWELCVDP